MLKKFISSLTAALFISLVAPAASAQQVNWRLAHVFPEHSSVGEAANMFAKLAAERSSGRIKIAVYPAGQLGGDEAIGRELMRGTLDMALVIPNSMVGIDPMFDFHILPFIASSYADVDRIYYGGPDNVLRKTLRETIERHRMQILGFFENDFRAISNSKKPVKTVDDLKGLKLRVVPSQSLRKFFEQAGSQVVIMPFPELFTALQQGTVDGQENGVILMHQARFYEAQKHLSLINHSYVMSTITASQRSLQRLSAQDQELMKSIGKEVGEWQVKRNRANAQVALAELKKAGIEIHEPTPQEMAGFRALGERIWNEMTPIYGKERITELRKLIQAK